MHFGAAIVLCARVCFAATLASGDSQRLFCFDTVRGADSDGPEVRLEAEQTEIMEGKLKSMEAHVAALEQECTRLADARDWLESEKIIMEQDLMAEIHRLEQEVRRAHDERDRLSLVQRIFDDQQQRGGAGAAP